MACYPLLTITQFEKQLTVHCLAYHPTNKSECPTVPGPVLGPGGLEGYRQSTPASAQLTSSWGRKSKLANLQDGFQ